MKITVDISLYPNNEDFIPPIMDFIAALHRHEGVEIRTSATSTIVQGDYDHVMDILKQEFRAHREKHGMGVFVTKFLPGYEAL